MKPKRSLFYIAILLLVSLTLSCQPQAVDHDLDLGGVGHSDLLPKGVEKCDHCHGSNLQGRTHRDVYGQLETTNSCYECHGNMWDLAEHILSYNGTKHQYLSSNATISCGNCHGDDLKGDGILEQFKRPSCYSCHNNLWDYATSHTLLKGTDGIAHKAGDVNTITVCSGCHGANLKGGAGTSCYNCHAIGVDHTVVESEDSVTASHMTNLKQPTTYCVACHGSDLRGGWANSCYECHGNEWDESSEEGDD